MNHLVSRAVAALVLLPSLASAGGAWMPAAGRGDLQFGFSRKTASSSWDSFGHAFDNTTNSGGAVVPHHHDFRYGYMSGEVGLHRRLSARFLVTYLHGLEGPHAHLEKNTGASDAWFGVKFAVSEGRWPSAIAATVRTAAFYDRPGPYSRYVTDAQGNRVGVSSEWRGVLKSDYTLSYLVSHSFANGGWTNLETGYTMREGAPADQVPFSAELGWPLPWLSASIKGSLNSVHSLGNDSPAEPDDRFRARAGFNFNDASMARAGVAVIVPLRERVDLEAGYNQWIWGKSARRYREPYVSIGYRF